MNVAVVILNWNGRELLQQFLPSVIRHSEGAVIYVADNASTDDSIQAVMDTFPTVNIIRNRENYGFAKGYNEALKEVSEPVYALVNSDIEVTANWLQPVLNRFEQDANVAIIQPKIKDFKNKSMFEYAGAAGGMLDKYGYPFCRGRLFDTIEEDLGQYDDNIFLDWASGACFFIRRDVYWQAGGFDESFFAHQEEIDLCWRVRNEGHAIVYCPDSVVYHVGGATLDKANPRKTFLNFRNSLLMLAKNLPKEQIVPIILSRLILDGLAGVQFLFQGKLAHCTAIIRAHFGFYGMVRSALRKRRGPQMSRYYQLKSIVYAYFIKKRSRYSDLF